MKLPVHAPALKIMELTLQEPARQSRGSQMTVLVKLNAAGMVFAMIKCVFVQMGGSVGIVVFELAQLALHGLVIQVMKTKLTISPSQLNVQIKVFVHEIKGNAFVSRGFWELLASIWCALATQYAAAMANA